MDFYQPFDLIALPVKPWIPVDIDLGQKPLAVLACPAAVAPVLLVATVLGRGDDDTLARIDLDVVHPAFGDPLDVVDPAVIPAGFVFGGGDGRD